MINQKIPEGWEKPLHKLLQQYELSLTKEQEQEKVVVSRFYELLSICDRPFVRTSLPGHITASAWIANFDGGKVLLCHHRKLDMWLQLGGHVDGEICVIKAALREAAEESGLNQITPLDPGILDLDIHLIPARPGEPAHYHYDVRFLLQANPDHPLQVSEESNDLAWVDVESLEEWTQDKSLIRLRCKALKTLGSLGFLTP